MDFGLAFTFPFKDIDWLKKIGLTALVSLIPIVGQLFLLGWSLEITRRVIRHDPVPLPDLNLGENLGKGFMVWIIGLVYSIPLIIIATPYSIISNSMTNNGNDTGNVVFIILSLCFGIFSIIYGLILAFMMPAAIGRFAAEGQLGAAFKLKEVFALVKAAPVAYLIVILGVFIGGIIAPLGLILCIIGVILTAVYVTAISGHLYGQAYNEARKNMGYASIQ